MPFFCKRKIYDFFFVVAISGFFFCGLPYCCTLTMLIIFAILLVFHVCACVSIFATLLVFLALTSFHEWLSLACECFQLHYQSIVVFIVKFPFPRFSVACIVLFEVHAKYIMICGTVHGNVSYVISSLHPPIQYFFFLT